MNSPVDYRKTPSSPTSRHDRCKSHIVLGTFPDQTEHEDDSEALKQRSPSIDRKLSTSTPSIADSNSNEAKTCNSYFSNFF